MKIRLYSLGNVVIQTDAVYMYDTFTKTMSTKTVQKQPTRVASVNNQ